MKHLLTIEQRLAGARKARIRLEQRVLENPRYRGLLVGIKKHFTIAGTFKNALQRS